MYCSKNSQTRLRKNKSALQMPEKACPDLLSPQHSAACIVQVEEGLEILEIVCCLHLLQGPAGETVQGVIPLSQVEHELRL